MLRRPFGGVFYFSFRMFYLAVKKRKVKNKMKKSTKFISLALALMCLAFSFVGCGDDEVVDNTPKTENTSVIEVGNQSSGKIVKLVIGGTNEVVYSVDYSGISLDKGALSVIEYLAANKGLEYEIDGTMLTRVGAIKQDLSTATYVYLWTSVEADFDVSEWAPENKSWNGKTLIASGVGASDMTIENGAVIYIGTVKY